MATTDLCIHGNKICAQCVVVTDAGKRAYDIVQSYVVFTPADELRNAWVALRLHDGGSDGTLYPSKREAIRHQSDEFLCAYFSYRNSPSGFTSVKDAQIWLNFVRAAYDSGFRLPDPDAADGGKDLIMPLTREHIFGQLGRLQTPGNSRLLTFFPARYNASQAQAGLQRNSSA